MSPPRRVLFVNTPTYVGGAEISLLELMKNLRRERYTAHLVASPRSELLKRARAAGVSASALELAHRSRRRPWRYALSVARLARTIRGQSIDIVHTNCDHSLEATPSAAGLAGVPYVSHVRDFGRAWFAPRYAAGLHRARRVIANSSATAAACTRAGIEPSRIVTIYSPIDTQRFRQTAAGEGERVRAELGIPAEALVAGIVGQIQEIKGHRELLEAALRLAESLAAVHFVMVGAPPPTESDEAFAAELRARIRFSAHASRFHMVGFREDIAPIMRAIDVLAVPSWEEPFGRVAVEGMAAGCAVVGTRAGGLPEIINDGANGLLVAAKNVDALHDALHRLFSDPDLRRRLAQSGVAAAERFATAHHVEQMEALYDVVLSETGKGTRI